MKSLFLKISTVALVVMFAVSFASPQDARAQSESCPWPGCFSGYSLPLMYSCTCDPYYSWMIFFPFHTNGMITAAAMSVPPVVAYEIYSTSPSQKMVGTYIPGVQSCYIYAVYGCYPLPVYGTVLEVWTGTSQVGPFY
jgi:hypothetical protein